MKRYLIEDLLPLAELSKEAKREKAIRHGHISTLHVWWARRPLVVARAAVLGALLPSPESEEERERLKRFLINLCNWDAHPSLIEEARKLLRQHYPDGPPKVLDSFAGGGSIPLEALRLGCEAYAVEYNPVAYLILKATLEYPQRYGVGANGRSPLHEDVERWGKWVLERARAELAEFYPKEPDGATPIAYIWSRTVRCPNPACGAEIPLFRQFWLAKKPNKRIALKPIVNHYDKRVDFEVVTVGANEDWPSQGTVRRATAHCLLCGGTADDDYLRSEAQAERMGHRLVAVVKTTGRGSGRQYAVANSKHIEAFKKAARRLEELKANHKDELSLVPDEPSPGTIGQGASQRPTYGLTEWGKYFNPRQALALATFARLVREAHEEIKKECCNDDYAKAVATYLGLAVDRLGDYNSILCSWHTSRELIRNTFSGHHLHMIWDYTEIDPFSISTGGFEGAIDWIKAAVSREAISTRSCSNAMVGSAASLSNFIDSSLHAVVIDPPYYDNVPYADLSDFFYVWLKRSVGHLYPDAFQTQLTPKDEEIVHNPARWATAAKSKRHQDDNPNCACAKCISHRHYERLLTQSFQEIHRVLKDEGLAVIMFTHKSTAAWESLIQSLLNAGLYPTASWPVHTEMEASTHTRGKGSIVSTILLACRKRPTKSTTAWYHELKPQLEARVRDRLKKFWEVGISGADFFVSAIGPAVEIFGRYDKVLHPSGETITVSELLDEVRRLVADFALEMILKTEGVGQVDAPTRFYVLFRWAYDANEVPYDDARKLSQVLGVELDALAHVGLAKKLKDKVRVLAALDRDPKSFERQEGPVEAQHAVPLLINGLHKALVLWEKGDLENLQKFLAEEGLLEAERFWRAAQALVSVLPEGDEERKLLEQLMPAREGLLRRESLRETPRGQKGLFEEKGDR